MSYNQQWIITTYYFEQSQEFIHSTALDLMCVFVVVTLLDVEHRVYLLKKELQ